MKIVLASASPRRSDLLKAIAGIDFSVLPSSICENIGCGYVPELFAMKLAGLKAADVFASVGGIVLGADTIVVLDGKILGKPATRCEALAMLMSLSGVSHCVITGVCFCSETRIIYSYDKSVVEFCAFDIKDIEPYVDSGSCFDKAGGYGIQDEQIARLITKREGSLTNIIGLPTELLEKILGDSF